LSGSRILGAVLVTWLAASVPVSAAVSWLSAYNQVFGSLLIVIFVAAVQQRRSTTAALILCGMMLSHEVLVIASFLPLAVALSHGWPRRGAWWMAACGVFCAAGWFWFIRVESVPQYTLALNHETIASSLEFLRMLAGFVRQRGEAPPISFVETAALFSVAGLLIAIGATSAERRLLVAFTAWAILLTVPFLLLTAQKVNYYGMIPAVCGSVAIAVAWRTTPSHPTNAKHFRGLFLILLAVFAWQGASKSKMQIQWLRTESQRVWRTMHALQESCRHNPGRSISVSGLDPLSYDFSFRHLIPGTLLCPEEAAASKGEPGGDRVWPSRETWQARLNDPHGIHLESGRDGQLNAMQATSFEVSLLDPPKNVVLGPGWHQPEYGGRWTSREAEGNAPEMPAGVYQIQLEAFLPKLSAPVPRTLTLSVTDRTPFSLRTLSPGRIQETWQIEGSISKIRLALDREFVQPPDRRKLGIFVTRLVVSRRPDQ